MEMHKTINYEIPGWIYGLWSQWDLLLTERVFGGHRGIAQSSLRFLRITYVAFHRLELAEEIHPM